jgi:putative transposase
MPLDGKANPSDSETKNGGSRLSSLPLPPSVDTTLTIRRRSLPHWESGGATYFVTFRLQGVPGSMMPLSTPERALVKNAILFWHPSKWQVHLLTVMTNHVHILATPSESGPGTWYPLSGILQSVKGYTAHAINASRNTKGRPWQSESFDRIVRDAAEYDKKAAYILNNAVKAGLVADGLEYEGFWYDLEA